jgi:hypothetical protein
MNNMKNLFELSEEQKNEIRNLHESYKNAYGTRVIKEQGDSTYTPNTDEIDVYYFGTAGPNTEKIYHDNEKIYYFNGKTANVIWEKNAPIGYAYDVDTKKIVMGSELITSQEKLQTIYKQLLLQEFGPLQYKWVNQTMSTYYLVMFGDNGKMFLNAIAPVVVSRSVVKEKRLSKAVVDDNGYKYVDYNKTYIPIKGRRALITEIGFGKKPITSNSTPPPPPPPVIIPDYEFTLTDVFNFDTIDLKDPTKLDTEIENFMRFMVKAIEKGKFLDILNTDVVIKGYASSDGDPSEKVTGKYAPCSDSATRGDYDKCLSQKRAEVVANKLNDAIKNIPFTLYGKPSTLGAAYPDSTTNWARAEGMGQDSSQSKIDWTTEHDPKETAKDRRIVFTPKLII